MPSVPPPQTVQDATPQSPAPPMPARGDDEPPWAPWTVPAAVLVGLGIGILASALVQIVAAAAGSSVSHPPPAVSLIENLVFDLSFVAAAIYFALRAAGGFRPDEFGFRRVSPSLAIAAMTAAGIGYYVVTAVYASLVKLHGSDKLPSELGVNKSTAALVGAAVFVCVIAPMAEELFFRGFIFGALRRWRISIAGREVGTWLAAILTGIFFGLVHAGSAAAQYLIPLAFLGFVLCLVRWRTRSLYPCMALHSINNSLALGINQLHWSALAIAGLMAAALLVITSITGPLSTQRRQPRESSPDPAL